MYKAGQTVEVVTDKNWSDGFHNGARITLERLIPEGEAFRGEWDAVASNGVKGIIGERNFRAVSEGPVRTETVTKRHIVPGVYGRLSVTGDIHPYVSIALTSPGGTGVYEGDRRSFNASQLRELARVALELAEYLEGVD